MIVIHSLQQQTEQRGLLESQGVWLVRMQYGPFWSNVPSLLISLVKISPPERL
jgi:hypothetical protein